MANTWAPSGFHEAFLWGAGAPNYATGTRALAYNYSSQIAFGDPVYLTSSGVLNVYAVAGTSIDGIAYGVEYFDPNNPILGAFHPAWTAPTTLASTAIVSVKVQMDPRMVFYAQANGAALTASAIGQNIDIYTSSSGSPVTGSGMSQCGLDATNVHTTATLPFRIVGILGLTPGFSASNPIVSSGYSATAANQWLAVTLNTQDMPAGTRTGQA